MANKILMIEESKSKYRYCNVCHKQLFESKAGNLMDDNRMHELSFGRDHHSTTICLCSECLVEFSDNLWQYLEENI